MTDAERVPSRVVYPNQVAIFRRVSSRETTKKALAAKLHISREWLERVMRGEVALGAETCLRIALEYDEDALSMMRAAGKGELADLLERGGNDDHSSVRTSLAAIKRGLELEATERGA